MIRRKAALVGTGEQGFVLAWLVKVDEVSTETMKVIFEDKATGVMTERIFNEVKFSDGSPDVINELN